jgi:energy-coupling factor transporter ATP-binding protein EcfA2
LIDETGNFLNLVNGQDQQINFEGVYDPLEICCDENERPIEITFDLPTLDDREDAHALTRAVFSNDRHAPQNWRGKFFLDETKESTERFLESNGRALGFKRGFVKLTDGRIDCRALFSFMRAMTNSLYVGPFRNAINEGGGRHFDLTIGSAFVSTWHEWKAGNSKAQNLAIQKVTDEIRHIFEFKTLEINAATDMKTLQLSVNGKPYKLGELGSGLAQFVIVLANAMIRRPSVIMIDEPELNLHPTLQIDFLTTLASYSSDSIVFATHSLGLARSCAERIYAFQRTEEKTLVTAFDQTPFLPEFLGEMSYAGFRELGFDKILLVEGAHDVRTAHQFLRKLSKDHKIVVLPLGGTQLVRDGVEAELAEIQRISSQVAVLIDSERGQPEEVLSADRQAFMNVCRGLGFNACITERRAIENYLSDAAVKRIKGAKYRALQSFERLRDAPLGWGKHENWRIAREMAWTDISETDVGRFFDAL